MNPGLRDLISAHPTLFGLATLTVAFLIVLALCANERGER